MANRFLNNIRINDAYTFPASDGTNGQVITTDGNGNLSFEDVTATGSTSSNYVYYNVKNSSGSTINKGTAVRAVGTDGNSGHILIAPMVADGSVEPKYFMGVLASTLDNGDIGEVIHFGELDQIDTSTFQDGDVLWCDPSNDGGFTTTEPLGPNLKIAAAIVINASTNGKIKVRVQGNEGLHELHDVKITTQADGELLVWDNTTGAWVNNGTIVVDHTNQRVGIGTSSPTEKLSVNGTFSSNGIWTSSSAVTSWGAYPTAFGVLTWDSGYAKIYSVSGKELHLGASGAAADVVINTSGNVGIGTSSPNAKLNVDNGHYLRTNSTNTTQENILLQGAGYYSGSSLYGNVSIRSNYDNSTNKADLSFYVGTGATNTTERMRIDSSGNVGINCIPNSELDVQSATGGNSYVVVKRTNATATELKIGAENGNTVISSTGAYPMLFSTNGSEKMRIDSSGRVGIGTSSPDYALDIYHSSKNVVARFESGDQDVWIDLQDNTSGTYGVLLGARGGDFRIAPNNNDAVWVKSTGEVGIGTTAPAQKLHVGGNILADRFVQNNSLANANTWAEMILDSDAATDCNLVYAVGGSMIWDAYVESTDNSYRLNTKASGGSGVVFTATQSGNVGIGTTSPSQKLSVDGGVSGTVFYDYSNTAYFVNPNSSTTSANFAGKVQASTVGVTNIVTNKVVKFNGTILDDSIITDDGTNVGVGTTSPSAKLHVAGDINSEGPDGGMVMRSWQANANYGMIGTANMASDEYALLTDGTNTFISGGANGYVSIRGGANDTTPVLYVNGSYAYVDNGNFGIGTATPNGNLQFANDVNTRKIVLYEGANNDYQFYGFGVESNTLVYSTYTTNDDHVFFAGTSSTARNELMRITGTGELGIGTTTPGATLDVNGDVIVGDLTADNTILDSLIVKNTGGTVGYTHLGTINNHNGNNYTRGSIIFSRDQDQITYDNTTSEWTVGGGGSTDWSAIMHHSDGVRFYVGAAIASNTVFTHTAFKNAYNYMSVSTSGNVNLLLGDLQIDGTTVIDSSRNITANNLTAGTATIGGILLQDSSDRGGLLEINKKGTSSWSGIQINHGATLWSFMSNASNVGVYDDTNSKWAWIAQPNSGIELLFNGAKQAETENGYFLATNQMRSPIYYDSNNTAYYIDPASTSNLNALNVGGAAVWTSANDGSGSGLDADTLDGLQSTSFLRSDVSDTATELRIDNLGINTAPRTDSYKLALGGSIYTGNNSIDYVNQLHFYDNVRFYDDGNDSYLNFKYGDTNNGGIIFLNGSSTQKGYLYANNSGFGLLSADGSWAVQTTNSDTTIHHSVKSPIFYDSNNTGYYIHGDGQSILYNLNINGALYSATGLAVPYAAGQHKPMVVLSGATNYGLFHTEASNDEFTFDFGGTQMFKFRQDGVATFNSGTVWTSANDGSGSGLDADTVDGIQGSQILKRWAGTVSSVSNSGYTTAFTVAGDNLSSSIRFSAQGTTGSVVVANLIDLVVNHSQDIMIKAQSGVYTRLYVKVVSNDNEDFAVELKTNSANAVTLNLEVITYGSESVTFTNSHSFTGASLEHDCAPGFTYSGTGGAEADIKTNGDISAGGRVYVGTGGGNFYNDASSRVRIDQDFYTNNANTYLYANNLYLGNSSGDNLRTRGNRIFGNNWSIETNGEIYSPKMYDQDNTAYYINPAGTSEVVTLNAENIQKDIAQAIGWVPAYSNANIDTVRWNSTELAMELQSDTDASIGAAFRAVRAKAGDTIRFTVTLKGSTASTAGLYLRIYYYAGDLPNGKTHVSNSASYGFVQEDTGGDTSWISNQAVPSTWTTYEYDYEMPVDGYVSLVTLNWTTHGNNSIYYKTPDVQIQSSPGVTVISSNTTATPNRMYVLTASLTLTLPSSPVKGEKVIVSNMSGTTTPVIARNGSNIMGLAENLTLDVENIGITLVYSGNATKGWVII